MPPANSDIPSVCGILFFMKRLDIAQIKAAYKPKDCFLTPIKLVESKSEGTNSSRRQILCYCECGNKRVLTVRLYLLGKVKRCSKDCPCNTKGRHGYSKGGKNKLYQCWLGMKQRCKIEPRYIKKGITVCDEWEYDFRAFLSWAILNGWEEGLQIDRINNNNSYCPNNCRFVTPLVNVSNRDCTIYIEHDNKRLTIREWSILLNFSFSIIYWRYKNGWLPEDILTPKKQQGTKLIQQKLTQTLKLKQNEK